MNRRIIYPTPDQLSVLCRWVNDGPESLYGEIRRANGQDMTRTHNMRKLSDLVERIALPDGVERLLEPVRRRPLVNLDPVLKEHMVSVCRFYGYVYWPAPGDRLDVTPLSGGELHVLRLMASGVGAEDAAEKICTSVQQVRKRLRRGMIHAQAHSTMHLMAVAYRSGWLPMPYELKAITDTGVVDDVPGFLTESW